MTRIRFAPAGGLLFKVFAVPPPLLHVTEVNEDLPEVFGVQPPGLPRGPL